MRRASSCEDLSCSEERRGVTGAEGEGADTYLPRAMLSRLKFPSIGKILFYG